MPEMVGAYFRLEAYVRMFGRYPPFITPDSARRNGWICQTAKTPFEYILPDPKSTPLFIDPTKHSFGYLVVYDTDGVAVVPESAYARFRAELSRGKINIKSSWKKLGDEVSGLPKKRPPPTK